MEIIGWTGSFLFAVCAIPQAIQSARDGHSRGLNWSFLLAWFFGEIFTIIYVWPKADWPLISNYIGNLVILLFILRYKIWERKPNMVINFSFTPRSL